MTLLAVAVCGRGLVDPAAPVFEADDEALLRGSAAFETLPVYGGRPFLLDRHLARLRNSSEGLGLVLDDAAARSAVEAVVGATTQDHVLRIYLTSSSLIATAAALPEDLDDQRRRGLALRTSSSGEHSGLLTGVKSTSYALAVAARRLAEGHGDDDAVFVGGGYVLDATTANVWWRKGEVLFTPAVGPGVLPGVTREVIWELAHDGGLEVRDGHWPLAALVAAAEAFTTSSIREVMPVIAVDGAPIGTGRPGTVAARLQEALRLRSHT